jgi:hypothetical protein
VAGRERTWEIRLTEQAETWYRTLDPRTRARVAGTFQEIRHGGPTLGRPRVDRIKGSRFHNMKEMRPPQGNIRVLFAFDHDSQAIVLLGGDKTREGNRWYKDAIRQADQLYEKHLRGTGKERAWAEIAPGRGTRSEPRAR